jgi:hypothetical protein
MERRPVSAIEYGVEFEGRTTWFKTIAERGDYEAELSGQVRRSGRAMNDPASVSRIVSANEVSS